MPAGSPLRERPHPRAAAVTTIDAESELPLIERSGGWARVRYGARKGWVVVDPSRGGGVAEARGPGRADPALLARAEARLGGEAEGGSLGPWRLRTDVGPRQREDLLRFLDIVAAQVPGLYRERYGAGSPPGGPESDPSASVGSEVVVLFAREDDYRAFARGDVALVGLDEGGFAGFGMAALYAEGHDRAELAALLVHELTHLINSRRLGPDSPPWLEEGLANDLGYSALGPGGELDPEALGGEERVRGEEQHADAATESGGALAVEITLRGARAAFERVLTALRQGRLLPLERLTSLDWGEMTDPTHRDLAYAESAFFVRFLLDPGFEPERGRREAFRRFLDAIAAGGPSGPDALLDALDEGWASLEPAFHRWLAVSEP